MKPEKLEKIILLGITGEKEKDWRSKINDLNKSGTKEAALFLERFKPQQRKKIYPALLKSTIKKIPLVHIRDDISRKELQFLFDHFHTRCFTIHPKHFRIIKKWRGFYKYLYLEFGSLNKINPNVRVEKIGGFCVDLAHFKFESAAGMIEAEYINRHRHNRKLFVSNHINGYNPKTNTDVHCLTKKTELNYITELPKFIFGKIISLEMENPISEQLKYKKYIISLLTGKQNN